MFTVYNKTTQRYYGSFPDNQTASQWILIHLPWIHLTSIIKTDSIQNPIRIDFKNKVKFTDEDGCHDTNSNEGQENEVYQN